MAYWWVSQGKTYNMEKSGGYLWAPKKTKQGKNIYHWDTMQDVRKGDIIFSYCAQYIVAYAISSGSAYDSDTPHNLSGEEWEKHGRQIDVSYTGLSKPVYLPLIVDELQSILSKQAAHKPINVNGTGNQGYLFPLINEAGEFLLAHCKKASHER